MERPFPAYNGADPYLFVSYSHQDVGAVYREMAWLYEAGFNLWYDEGIHAGSIWRQTVANALADSSGCLFFLTKQSVISDNCLREINFALEEGIKVFTVRLDDTPMPRYLKFSLSDRQALVKAEHDDESFRTVLTKSLTSLTVKGPARILERPGSPSRYRTQIPLLCINPFSSPGDDDELGFYARSVSTDICRCMFSSSYYVTEGQFSDLLLKPEEVGRKYRAQYVLNGTLMKVGDRVRAAVRVAETTNGTQVWANNIEPSSGTLADMVADIASEVAADISFTFYQYELERLKDIPEAELDAWSLSIKTMAMSVRDVESARECLRLARLAIDRDNGFAESHANLADVILNIIITLLNDEVDCSSEEALEHCNKALILNKNAVYVLNRCSRVHRVLGNESLALELARRVDSLTSGEFTYTLYPALIINGLAEEVVSHAKNNPRATYAWTSDALTLTGRYEEAEKWIRKSVARNPGSYMGWMRLANVLGHLGKCEEGRDIVSNFKGVSPPAWSVETYERSLRIIWRDRNDIVLPLISGLKKISEN